MLQPLWRAEVVASTSTTRVPVTTMTSGTVEVPFAEEVFTSVQDFLESLTPAHSRAEAQRLRCRGLSLTYIARAVSEILVEDDIDSIASFGDVTDQIIQEYLTDQRLCSSAEVDPRTRDMLRFINLVYSSGVARDAGDRALAAARYNAALHLFRKVAHSEEYWPVT